VPLFLNDCVKAEHLKDAVPLSDVPLGLLRKEMSDINGIVVANLGEKMKDYKGYQSRLDQLLSENKTDDEICRVLAHKAVTDLVSFGINNEDGTWDVVEVEVDASFSEPHTKHNDELPMVIRHRVFGENCDYQVKDLVKCNAKSHLQYRGVKKVGANHEEWKKVAEGHKTRGVKPLQITFNLNAFHLGTHSIEEGKEKFKNAKLLTTVTKKLVRKNETDMPSKDQVAGMLEHIGSRVMRDGRGNIQSSSGIPDGPANTQVILQEYNKEKAERDQCKYHSVSIVNHSLVLTSRSTAHSSAASIEMKEVKVSVKLGDTTMNEEKQLVAFVPDTPIESSSSNESSLAMPVLSRESSMILDRTVVSCSSDSESSLLPSDLPPLPPVSKISSDDFDSPLSSSTKDVKVSVVLNGKKMSDKRLIATQADLSRWIQPSNEYNYYGSICDDAPPLIQSLHYYHNRSYYKNNTYDYLLSSRATKRQRVESSGPPAGWNCPDCTLLNDVSDVSCKVCWYTLPRKRKSRS